MSKELVLDIGIGAGGEYVTRNTTHNEQRIGVDIFSGELAALRTNYPDVLPVLANAQRLPFSTDTFSRIEFVLPYEELLIPGLENDHFALLEKYRDGFPQTHPNGWYPEFHRVLMPRGELVIYGDFWTDPTQVQKTSQQFFNVTRIRPLSVDEFCSLGTKTVVTMIDAGRRNPFIGNTGKKWENTLVKINLRKRLHGHLNNFKRV